MDCCTKNRFCFVCRDELQMKLAHVQCVRCNVYMHESCYVQNKVPDLGYTQCPSCQRIGTIGIKPHFIAQQPACESV